MIYSTSTRMAAEEKDTFQLISNSSTYLMVHSVEHAAQQYTKKYKTGKLFVYFKGSLLLPRLFSSAFCSSSSSSAVPSLLFEPLTHCFCFRVGYLSAVEGKGWQTGSPKKTRNRALCNSKLSNKHYVSHSCQFSPSFPTQVRPSLRAFKRVGDFQLLLHGFQFHCSTHAACQKWSICNRCFKRAKRVA